MSTGLQAAMWNGRIGEKFRPPEPVFPSRPKQTIAKKKEPPPVDLKWLQRDHARLSSECRAQSAEIRRLVNEIERMKQQRRRRAKTLSMYEIINACADYFDVTPKEIMGGTMRAPELRARQVACYIAAQMTALEPMQIARPVGYACGSTAMHGVAQTQERRQTDKQLDTEIVEIMFELDHMTIVAVAS